MAGVNQLIGGPFVDAENNVLNDGYLIMELSQDEQLSGSQGQVCGGIKIKINLNSSGNVSTSPTQSVWTTDQMNPSGASYTVLGYTAAGQLAWGPNYGLPVLSSPSPWNVDAWVPNQIGGGGSGAPVGSIVLETNGVQNGSQQLLNLVNGTNITITDDGMGDITIASAGSTTDIVQSNWHKLTFANTSGSPDFIGDGLGVIALALGGAANGLQYRPPVGAEPILLQVGGAKPQESAVYEFGADPSLGATDSGPINLSTMIRWQARLAVGTRYMSAWTANTRVPNGTILLNSGTYYVQVASASGQDITGASIPSFDSTPGHSTSDNAATWFSIGSTRPITYSDAMFGIADYQGTNIGGSGFSQFPLGMDPTLTNAPGPGYNFIGFRYLPEPLATNGSTGNLHWYAYCGGINMTPQIVDTGVAPDNSGASHLFEIKQTNPNVMTFYIDGSQVAQITISGLTNPFSTVVYGSNQQGDYNYSYSADPVGLGATTLQGGNWWQAVVAGTPTGSASFPGSPTNGQTLSDGGVTWLAVWGSAGSTAAPPMAIALSYLFWETTS